MRYYKSILFTLIALVIIDVIRYLSWVGDLAGGYATYILTFLFYVSIGIFIKIAYTVGFGSNNIPKSIQNLFKLWLFWNIFSLIRGGFLASDYWDWKFLLFSSLSFSLIPLVFFLGKDLLVTKTIFKLTLKYLFQFGFLFIPLTLVTNEELYSRLMIPISLFILFIPYLKFKWKLLIIIVATISILMVVGFRSNIIKSGFSVLLLLIFYFHNYIKQGWLRLIHLSLFAIPILMLTLAVMDSYNVFSQTEEEEEGYSTTNKVGEEENLMIDTRTFLYVDIFTTLENSGNWLFGEGAAGSYQSDWFYDDGGAIQGKRFGCEVGILNNLLRNGIIGVILYFLLLYAVSFLAIQHSANILSKMLGLFIAFRWTYSFVEEFTQYDLNFFFFWIAIGLVSSINFRRMTDSEIINYLELK